MKRLWFGLVLAAAGAACVDTPVEPSALSGTYEYLATDSSGNALLAGQLDLTFHADSTVTGSWVIDWAPEADSETQVGPQVGTGTLVGSLDALGVDLDLNPTVADDNVLLSGAFTLERLTQGFAGEWHHTTLTGPIAAGFFTADRQPLPD